MRSVKLLTVLILFLFLFYFIDSVEAGWFGNKNYVSSRGIENYIQGSSHLFVFDGNFAFAHNISVYLNVDTNKHNVSCGFYLNGSNDFVFQTEHKNIITVGWEWVVFNFSSSVLLSNNTQYLLVVYSNNTVGGASIGRDAAVSGWGRRQGRVYDGSFPDPFVEDANFNTALNIYYSYTIINTSNPVQNGESPINGSSDVGVDPDLFVLLTDADGDDMNATWHTNVSGSWIQFATNTSIGNDTNITQSYVNFKGYNTTYWWSVNVSDGEGGWCNETYSFTTEVVTGGITRISRGAIWYLAIIAGFLAMAGFFIIRREHNGKHGHR